MPSVFKEMSCGMSVMYIHYGSKEFEPMRFMPIKNKELGVKPEGGLWASPVGCEFGWKEWCASSEYSKCDEENSFLFSLSENANILYINSVCDLDSLPKASSIIPIPLAWVTLDFKKLLKDGIDAVQVNMSDEVCNDFTNAANRLYFKLYGWDCDSTLVMNRDVIVI